MEGLLLRGAPAIFLLLFGFLLKSLTHIFNGRLAETANGCCLVVIPLSPAGKPVVDERDLLPDKRKESAVIPCRPGGQPPLR